MSIGRHAARPSGRLPRRAEFLHANVRHASFPVIAIHHRAACGQPPHPLWQTQTRVPKASARCAAVSSAQFNYRFYAAGTSPRTSGILAAPEAWKLVPRTGRFLDETRVAEKTALMMITMLAPAVRIASESMGRRATRAQIRSPIGNPRAPISRAAISLPTRRRGPDTAVIPLPQYAFRLPARTTHPNLGQRLCTDESPRRDRHRSGKIRLSQAI
jgi:hypothetical protein